ncbi:MAG: hypothetical protein ABIO44_13330, partial [Saprospiraceae bacterium]
MAHEHYIIPFGTDFWWVGLIGFFFISILILLLGKHLTKSGKEPIYRRILFWILLIREVVFYAYTIYLGKFTLQDSLPLHLCNISYIGLLIFLYNPNAFIFEFLILLGIGGALQSILTPELTHGYSPYLFIDYYISHSA